MTDEAREWFEAAVALEEENRQLRAWLTSALWWIAQRRELLDLCQDEINRRWPE